MPEQPSRKINVQPSLYPTPRLPEADIEVTLRVLASLRNVAHARGDFASSSVFGRAFDVLAQKCHDHNQELEEGQSATTGHTNEAVQQPHGDLCRCDACICC